MMTATPSTIASAYWRTKPDWILRRPSALLRIADGDAGHGAVDHRGLHDGLVEVGHRGERATDGRVVEVVPVPDVLQERRLVALSPTCRSRQIVKAAARPIRAATTSTAASTHCSVVEAAATAGT